MNTSDKKTFYHRATQKILNDLNGFGLTANQKRKAVKFVQLFRESFLSDKVKQETFITETNQTWNLGYDSGGFCRVASITFAIAMGISDWQLMAVDSGSWNGGLSHHYLKHIPSGKFLDLTFDQFAIKGISVPYDKGKETNYALSASDETHKFVNALGLNLVQLLTEQKGK